MERSSPNFQKINISCRLLFAQFDWKLILLGKYSWSTIFAWSYSSLYHLSKSQRPFPSLQNQIIHNRLQNIVQIIRSPHKSIHSLAHLRNNPLTQTILLYLVSYYDSTNNWLIHIGHNNLSKL